MLKFSYTEWVSLIKVLKGKGFYYVSLVEKGAYYNVVRDVGGYIDHLGNTTGNINNITTQF